MAELAVTRTLKAPRARVWQVLTEAPYFESWLPAKPGSAVLDVRTGGSWRATVVSAEGEEIPVSGPYAEVSVPERMVMSLPGDVVADIGLADTAAGTEITYAFDVPEDLHSVIEEGVDDVLAKVAQILAML
jgi:hypothetical protein